MEAIWQDPNLRILLIVVIAAFGALFILCAIIFIMLIHNMQLREKQRVQKPQKLKGFIKRLSDIEMPPEITGIIEELRAELEMLQESTEEHFKTFSALALGIEEKVKLVQVSHNLMEQKMVATLTTIVSKLKKANKEQVDRHAKGFFQKLNRLENEEIKRLEERLIEVETFIEAAQMIKGTAAKADSSNKNEG